MTTVLLILIAIISYALGNLNGAIIASRYIFRKDVRKYGSGNAGLTNFYRTFGAGGVAMVLAIDLLKATIAVLLGGLLLGFVDEPLVGKLFAGFCVIMGHSYPALYQFRGGKGVLCGGAITLLCGGWIGVLCLTAFAVTVIFTRYVSLGSIIASALFPLLVWIAGKGGLEGTLALFCALVVIWGHRGNIIRLLNGTERKLNVGPRVEKKLDDEEF